MIGNEYTKFSDDNIRQKIKYLELKNLLVYINKQIKKNNGNIGKGLFIKELQIINKKQILHSNISFNKEFIKRKNNPNFLCKY